MEENPRTLPKRKIYLMQAFMCQGQINAIIFRNDSPDVPFKSGDNFITLPIIQECGDHVFESALSIYIIVDKSL